MNMATQNVARHGDEAIEQEIQEKGKTAPRVTPAHIESVIASEHYFTAAEGVFGSDAIGSAVAGAYGGDLTWIVDNFLYDVPKPATHVALSLLTFCVLILRNGFTVTGESACVSPENFDGEIGRKVARANAIQKIWPLEGYLLKDRLAVGARNE